jgi:hypothetical protein
MIFYPCLIGAIDMPRTKSEKVIEIKLEQKLEAKRKRIAKKIPDPESYDDIPKSKRSANKPRRTEEKTTASSAGQLFVSESFVSPYKTFTTAIKMFIDGKYVARRVWKDYYLCKTNDQNQMVIADPKRYGFRVYVPTMEDITADDWYVI